MDLTPEQLKALKAIADREIGRGDRRTFGASVNRSGMSHQEALLGGAKNDMATMERTLKRSGEALERAREQYERDLAIYNRVKERLDALSAP